MGLSLRWDGHYCPHCEKGSSDPHPPSHSFPDSSGLVPPAAALHFLGWTPAPCQHSPRERTRTEHLYFPLCCFCLFFIFNRCFLSVEVLVLTQFYLFIKYVQESAQVPVPPSKVGRACPANRSRGERLFLCLGVRMRRRRKERAEEDKDFKLCEQIFTGSKTKKYISTVLSWGYKESGLK